MHEHPFIYLLNIRRNNFQQITQHNEGPNGPNRLICEVCITRLRDACNFKKQVLDSEKKFIDMMGRGEFRPKSKMIYIIYLEF